MSTSPRRQGADRAQTKSRRRALAAIVLITVALLAGAGVLWATSSHPTQRTTAAHRVGVAHGALTLDGRPWWASGFNAYQLATDWSINAGCGAEVNLDAYFAALPPHSLTRFALFAPFTERKDDGTVDYRPVDAIFAAAARHDQLVLPVLAANDGACDGGLFRERSWYTDGWRHREENVHGTYRDWVHNAVTRWKDEPALAGWTPVGEAETSTCGTGDCQDYRTRRCPPGAAAVLRKFFDDTGTLIRTIDRRHPVFAGLVGGDQCGSAGTDYADVAASTGIDVAEYHYYRFDGDLPDDATPAARITQVRKLGKPLLVGEIGMNAGSCLPPEARAARVRQEINALRTQGVAGALAWAYVPDPRPHLCTYDIGPDDPLWPRLTP